MKKALRAAAALLALATLSALFLMPRPEDTTEAHVNGAGDASLLD